MSDILKKKDFQKLLDDTVDALQDVLKKAEETPPEAEALAKADPGKETPAEKKPSGDSAEGSSPEKKEPPKEESKEAPKEENKEAPEASASASDGGSDEAAPPAEGEAPPAAPEGAPETPVDPAAATGEVSVESLQAEYEGMPLDQQKMHLLALKAAMMKAMMAQEMAPPAAPAAAAPAPAVPPPAPAAAPPAEPPAQDVPPPVQKSVADPSIVSKLETLQKSVEVLEKNVKDKEEIINSFGKAVEGLKGVIISHRKAVTSVAQLAKTEPAGIDVSSLTRESVIRKLSEVAAAGSLKKSDRDLIVSFTVGTEKDVSKVAHLLK